MSSWVHSVSLLVVAHHRSTLFQSVGAISPTYKTNTYVDVLEAIKAVLALLEKLNYDI